MEGLHFCEVYSEARAKNPTRRRDHVVKYFFQPHIPDLSKNNKSLFLNGFISSGELKSTSSATKPSRTATWLFSNSSSQCELFIGVKQWES